MNQSKIEDMIAAKLQVKTEYEQLVIIEIRFFDGGVRPSLRLAGERC